MLSVLRAARLWCFAWGLRPFDEYTQVAEDKHLAKGLLKAAGEPVAVVHEDGDADVMLADLVAALPSVGPRKQIVACQLCDLQLGNLRLGHHLR